MTVAIRPITLAEAKRAVGDWHSHHTAPVGHRLSVGAFVDEALVAAIVWGRPVAAGFDAEAVWEVTRLAVGPDAPRYTATRLLGPTTSAVIKLGVRRCVSYTRMDERGTCYLAAGWHPTGIVKGREWVSGNKALRWLPGLYVPSSEVVDRVRWERGPDAAAEIEIPAMEAA